VKNTMVDTRTAMERTQECARTHNAEARMVRTIPIGHHVRQGDIFLTRIATLPEGLKQTTERQLAPGTTKGSRHILSGSAVAYTRTNGDVLEGPVVVGKERFVVEHPEHGNASIPRGVYSCTYQRDFAKEERARVMD